MAFDYTNNRAILAIMSDIRVLSMPRSSVDKETRHAMLRSLLIRRPLASRSEIRKAYAECLSREGLTISIRTLDRDIRQVYAAIRPALTDVGVRRWANHILARTEMTALRAQDDNDGRLVLQADDRTWERLRLDEAIEESRAEHGEGFGDGEWKYGNDQE